MPAKPTSEADKLAREIQSRIRQLAVADTQSLRAVRREFSRQIADASPEMVVEAALLLMKKAGYLRFVAYELVRHHKAAFASLNTKSLLKLGEGLDSWSSVDCFALYLSSPLWLEGRISDSLVTRWSKSKDRWWSRTALVSTVLVSRQGHAADIPKVVAICSLAVDDRDDMVVKALSWALRELAKKYPERVRSFVAEHRQKLATRVIREVENKLATGLKTPRRK